MMQLALSLFVFKTSVQLTLYLQDRIFIHWEQVEQTDWRLEELENVLQADLQIILHWHRLEQDYTFSEWKHVQYWELVL